MTTPVPLTDFRWRELRLTRALLDEDTAAVDRELNYIEVIYGRAARNQALAQARADAGLEPEIN